MIAEKDKVWCPIFSCFKYVEVCKICDRNSNCIAYQEYIRPTLF